MINNGVNEFIEIGPGKVLSGLVKRINKDVKVFNINSIDDITNYIDDYLKIIKYFKKKYPDKIMDIKLENLTENNEKIGKKIFNFCNLDWSNKSLNFSKKKDLQIKTTSNVQLREKVTKYDYDKYKQYKFILNDYTKKYKWL